MSMFPPGVTGNEYQIAGPDREYDEDRDVECGNAECDYSGTETVSVATFGGSAWFNWTCPECGKEHQEDLDDEDEREPDYDDEPDWD